jgi:hypothetical protein
MIAIISIPSVWVPLIFLCLCLLVSELFKETLIGFISMFIGEVVFVFCIFYYVVIFISWVFNNVQIV